jgi:hypothetical protein
MTYPEVASMKLFAAIAFCTLTVTAQDGLKHLVLPATSQELPMWLTAQEILRGPGTSETVHLKGSVEVRWRVCVPGKSGNGLTCDGYTVIRADEADVQGDSGAVDARGNVRITREK